MHVLFDIGGTKTRIALSEDLKTYGEPVKFDTLLDYEQGIALFIEKIRELIGENKVDGLAGGIRGILNHEKTCITNDPGKRLHDWVGRPIIERLKVEFDAPAFIENDTAIVGLGEAHNGAGKGHSIVAYHTVSTGVGGARIVDGAIDVSRNGFEPGHQLLDIDGTIIGAQTPHTLENLVSGSALEKRRGVKPYEISQEDEVWDELASYLARGLKNTITYWSPDVIVLGGSMIVGDPRIFLEDIVRHTEEVVDGLVECPPIVDAQLKDEGGLYGAMTLLLQRKV
jgi:predicted NBD/HSP70 family sugar kinase